MFSGHFGLSFAARKAAPQVSLGVLFIATQFVDILWPFLLMFNIEKVAIVPGYTKMNAFEFLHYPYTHSLFMGVVWGVVCSLIYYLWKRDKRGAIVIGLCVLSHWFLDLLVHVADLPLSPFSEYKLGLGLWNHLAIELILETLIFLTGVFIYATFTMAKNKAGKWGFWALVAMLLLFTAANTFGPTPPDSIIALSVSTVILMGLLVTMAYWVDKNRQIA